MNTVNMNAQQSHLHMAAFKGTISTLAALTPVAGDSFLQAASSTQFTIPPGLRLVGTFATGTTGTTALYLSDARLNSPSLLRVGLPSIIPLFLKSGEDLPQIQRLFDRPIRFDQPDVLGVDAAVTGAGDDVFALLIFADGFTPVPSGEAFWIKFNWTGTALLVGGWNPLQVSTSFVTALPSGNYAVTAIQHVGTSEVVAARLVFSDTAKRPGVVSVKAPYMRTDRAFTDGTLGVLGTFPSYNLPGVEVLVHTAINTAATPQATYLRLVKL
jgi:hypothetical protein